MIKNLVSEPGRIEELKDLLTKWRHTINNESEIDLEEIKEVLVESDVINEQNISFVNEIQTQEDVNFLLELFDIYIRDLPIIMAEIAFSITKKDPDKLKFYTHKLKGSALTLGIETVANYCIDLDNAAASPLPNDEVDNVNAKLLKSIENVVDGLKILKEKYRNLKL